MDATDQRLEVRDPNLDQVDPIGPPVLPKASRHTARALALSGIAIGTPLAAGVIGWLFPTPTWPPANL